MIIVIFMVYYYKLYKHNIINPFCDIGDCCFFRKLVRVTPSSDH